MTNPHDDQLGDWSQIRDDSIKLMHRLYTKLEEHGYESYRRIEMINPETGRHVRRGFAGGEWVVTVSDIPRTRIGSRGVSTYAAPVESIRIDLRHLSRVGRSLPTVDQLLSRIV